MTKGAPLLQVAEPQCLHKIGSNKLIIQCKPWVLRKFYECKWFKEKLDLSKLAKKRWIEGYSNQKLGEFFDLSPITIGQHLRRLKNSNLLDELESTENEDFQIREKWNS
ncbi:MAG: hypothetical protein QF441_16230 [Bacteriovoracaceae bacterium]|nr:hypothetical protein [Halobacteriovoraceae bacterium]MDP7322152.1 hypothetical protein [Bacteriovoracaceae bacterium]